jgi:hypothetical protein
MGKMYLPQAITIQNSRSLLRNFGGLNETYGCSEAEYGEGMNWSSRDFPALSTRQPRRRLKTLESVNGLYHLNGLLTITGTMLKYEPDDWNEATILIADAVTDDEKQMASMGTKILIWPDKKQFDTASGELSELGATWAYEPDEGERICFYLADADGNTYTDEVASGTDYPENPEDGQVFLLVKNTDYPLAGSSALQKYTAGSSSWQTITLEYCRIEATGIGANFNQWDTVHLEHAPDLASAYLAEDLEGDLIVYDRGDDYLLVKITPREDCIYFYGNVKQTASVTQWSALDKSKNLLNSHVAKTVIERQVPDLDYITECANRVWGCNSAENVLYACKLGDATNWYSYRGIAADSYAVTVGSDGAFTGAASCMNYVLFFKENTLHKVYGTKPSDFQASTLRCRGVAKGAAKSLRVINEALYYLSAEGVMTWSGSLPGKISATLDPDKLANATRAVGGTLDGRYYLQIEQDDTEKRLLVYDTERGLWQEESAVGHEMVSTGRQLYFWDGKSLWAALLEREKDSDTADATQQTESSLNYDWTSGDIGLDNPDDKYISRITVRMDAEAHSTVHFYASYDGGNWEQLGETANSATWARLDVPMIPARHNTMRLRIQGTGRVTLRSIAFTFAASRGKSVQGTK